jgi:hypothetical protein
MPPPWGQPIPVGPGAAWSKLTRLNWVNSGKTRLGISDRLGNCFVVMPDAMDEVTTTKRCTRIARRSTNLRESRLLRYIDIPIFDNYRFFINTDYSILKFSIYRNVDISGIIDIMFTFVYI